MYETSCFSIFLHNYFIMHDIKKKFNKNNHTIHGANKIFNVINHRNYYLKALFFKIQEDNCPPSPP
jgi:hypothetical protein